MWRVGYAAGDRATADGGPGRAGPAPGWESARAATAASLSLEAESARSTSGEGVGDPSGEGVREMSGEEAALGIGFGVGSGRGSEAELDVRRTVGRLASSGASTSS